ncbi:Protein of unknown function, partial [Gryllus bimaculatus]
VRGRGVRRRRAVHPHVARPHLQVRGGLRGQPVPGRPVRARRVLAVQPLRRAQRLRGRPLQGALRGRRVRRGRLLRPTDQQVRLRPLLRRQPGPRLHATCLRPGLLPRLRHARALRVRRDEPVRVRHRHGGQPVRAVRAGGHGHVRHHGVRRGRAVRGGRARRGVRVPAGLRRQPLRALRRRGRVRVGR